VAFAVGLNGIAEIERALQRLALPLQSVCGEGDQVFKLGNQPPSAGQVAPAVVHCASTLAIWMFTSTDSTANFRD
jgi:hypothetical protein